jgi:tetratricopeptide (TPR) repeat protein
LFGAPKTNELIPLLQDCREDIADLLGAGTVDAAAQRTLLAIESLAPDPCIITSAFHLVGLGVRYATEGNSTAAREAFDHALDIAIGVSDNGDLRPQIYRNVAAALDAAGCHASAARCLEASIELGSDGSAVWQALGRARLKGDDPAGALQALDHAQRLKPTADVVSDLVLAEMSINPSNQVARRALARLEASRPDQPSVRWDFAIGCAHQLSGDADASIAAFQRVLEHADGELGSSELLKARGAVHAHD